MSNVWVELEDCLPITPSLPCHIKATKKSAKFKPVSLFVFFFTLACERIFIRMHSIESRCVKGLENIVFTGAQVCPCIFQPRNCTGSDSEGANLFVFWVYVCPQKKQHTLPPFSLLGFLFFSQCCICFDLYTDGCFLFFFSPGVVWDGLSAQVLVDEGWWMPQ